MKQFLLIHENDIQASRKQLSQSNNADKNRFANSKIAISLKIFEQVFRQNIKRKKNSCWSKIKQLFQLTISIKQEDIKAQDQICRTIFFDTVDKSPELNKKSRKQSFSNGKISIFGQAIESSIKSKNKPSKLKHMRNQLIVDKMSSSFIEQVTQQNMRKQSIESDYRNLSTQANANIKRAKILNKVSNSLKQRQSIISASRNVELMLRVKNIQKMLRQIKSRNEQAHKPRILNKRKKKQNSTIFNQTLPEIGLVLEQIRSLKKQIRQIKEQSELHLSLIQRANSNSIDTNSIKIHSSYTGTPVHNSSYFQKNQQVKEVIKPFSTINILSQKQQKYFNEPRIKNTSRLYQSMKKQKVLRVQFQTGCLCQTQGQMSQRGQSQKHYCKRIDRMEHPDLRKTLLRRNMQCMRCGRSCSHL